MTIEEFAAIHNKYKGFFTNDESQEILYMIGKDKDFKSNRFNQTAREQLKPTPSKEAKQSFPQTLKCNRVITLTNNALKSNDYETVRFFFCNNRIRLLGFIIGTKDIDELDVDLMIGKIHL